MPLLFSRDQIKRHLAELGYENLPEAQLNVFIQGAIFISYISAVINIMTLSYLMSELSYYIKINTPVSS